MLRWRIALTALITIAGSMPGELLAQQNRGVAGAGMQYVNPMGTLLQWLGYPQVRKELELVDEQVTKIDALRTKTYERIRELAKSVPADRSGDWRQGYAKTQKELAAATNAGVKEILLKHQLDRLREIAFQYEFRRAGYGSASPLLKEHVARLLGISASQRKRLLTKQVEVQKDIQEKSRAFQKQLQEESREAILSVLTDTQRARLEQLLGEKFELRTHAGATN